MGCHPKLIADNGTTTMFFACKLRSEQALVGMQCDQHFAVLEHSGIM
jgi:hypothetical protein